MAIQSTIKSTIRIHPLVPSSHISRCTSLISAALCSLIAHSMDLSLTAGDLSLNDLSNPLDPEVAQAIHLSAAPPLIASILATDPSKSTPESRAVVWAFLRQAWNYDAATEGEWLLGVDEALSWLRRSVSRRDQTKVSEELSTGLTGLAANSTLPESEREFAIRHLGAFYSNQPCDFDALRVLSGVLQEDLTRPLCGVALQAIAQTGTEHAPLWGMVRHRALTIAADPSAHVRNRLAVFELVAAKCWTEFEPVICERLCIAQRVSERVAAFQTLTQIGDDDTRRWIETLPAEKDSLSTGAREAALQRLLSQSALQNCVESNPD